MVVLGGSRSSNVVLIVGVGRVELLLPGVPGLGWVWGVEASRGVVCGWLGGLEASRGVGVGDIFSFLRLLCGQCDDRRTYQLRATRRTSRRGGDPEGAVPSGHSCGGPCGCKPRPSPPTRCIHAFPPEGTSSRCARSLCGSSMLRKISRLSRPWR